MAEAYSQVFWQTDRQSENESICSSWANVRQILAGLCGFVCVYTNAASKSARVRRSRGRVLWFDDDTRPLCLNAGVKIRRPLAVQHLHAIN